MIVVFGTVCLDRIRRLPRFPGPGGYVEATEERTVLGGEAANTALTLHAWDDAPVLASNPLGDDANGLDLRARIAGRGVELCELRGARKAEAPVCDVFVTPDGERTMIGRGFSVLDQSIDLVRLPLAAGGLFTADANVEDAARAAVRKAQAAGMRTYLMDFLRPNEPLGPDSFWQASTDDLGARNDPTANRAYVDELTRRTGTSAILTDGGKGFVAGGPQHPARAYPSFPAPTLVDTTGAGDVFRAGMLHGLARGWAMSVCLQFASAAGALSVGYPGATGRVPSLREVAAHIAENPDVAAAFG